MSTSQLCPLLEDILAQAKRLCQPFDFHVYVYGHTSRRTSKSGTPSFELAC